MTEQEAATARLDEAERLHATVLVQPLPLFAGALLIWGRR